MARVFIDGSVGTTGLRIFERLEKRTDIELICLSDTERKDISARKAAYNIADVAFMCLPDDASKEAVSLVENPNTVLIDTSTAHRVAEGWVYGFAELAGQRKRIANAKRIANPGCHATGFISLVAPLVSCGIILPELELSCFSLTGYSGGGKKMIGEYNEKAGDLLFTAPRMYGLCQTHKHLPEMQKYTGLKKSPIFMPIVSPYYAGMEVVVPLHASQISGNFEAICERYRCVYGNGLVKFNDTADENGFMSAAAFAGRDDMELSVFGNGEKILLVSRFDNLGKGASGSAIQNMNLVLGLDETTGLKLGG